MSNPNIKNEIVKRNYYKWLKEAEGFCPDTIDKFDKAIVHYEDFTEHKDFSNFNSQRAIDYKNWLRKKTSKGKVISISTYQAYLRLLKKFFTWLCCQSGYKSKIDANSVKYLNTSDKEDKIATQYIPRKHPSLEEVIKIVNSISLDSEIDLRDRAIISFTALSGMRDKAIITLPIGCFDTENLIINQNPKLGVQTKFSKYICSILFKFDEKLVNYILEWVKYLKNKNFNSQDPLFPRNKIKQDDNNLSFETSDSVEPVYWKDTGRIREIFKKRSKAVNLEYFPPHTYRHLAIELALKSCKNGEQIKAVSQNFGHENLITTFCSYANQDPQKLSEILSNIDFSGKTSTNEMNKLEKIKEILNSD